ncbi:MAG: chain-length determining protein [Prevotella sp.]|nr:chain-length determining protein [Prevotella sp.]
MEENATTKLKVIDLRKGIKILWKSRITLAKTLTIAFVLSCIYIFSLPRFYITDTKLAPEIESSLGKGTLSSIASSFGFDIGEMQTTDAITPLLYPDLMDDNGFVTSLFSIQVVSKDRKIDTNYYDYLENGQKEAWWCSIFNIFKQNTLKDNSKILDPYNLTKEQEEIAKEIRNNVSIKANSKNGVITITTEAQDPYICKTLADSVRSKLRTYITNYRTNKARSDWEYYKTLTQEAKKIYEQSRQKYASFADANTNMALKSVESKLEDMENDMQIKFNTYNTLNTQLQAAKAKVQERTPAFTILKGASSPTKPAGPKRMLFVFIMLLVTFFGTSLWVLRHSISDIFA